MFQTSPMKDVKGYLSKEELDRFFSVIDSERDYLLFTLYIQTGRRVSEIIRCLTIKDILWDEKQINFTILKKSRQCSVCGRITKYNKESGKWKCGTGKDERGKRQWEFLGHSPASRPKKLIPINMRVLDILKKYIDNNGIKKGGFIFPISRQRVFQLMRKYGKKSNIEWVGDKRIHPHHLRHSFAVQMAKNIKNPADLKKLQDFLAHSDINITTFYLKFNPEESRKLLEKTWQ